MFVIDISSFGVAAVVSLLLVGTLVDRWLGQLVMASTALFLLAGVMLALWPAAPSAVYLAVGIWGLAFGGVGILLVTSLPNAAGTAQDVAQWWRGAAA